MTKPRHIELAQLHPCAESERDLVTYATLSDPDPWRLHKLPHAYLRRLKSLEAADRILSHEAAARSAMVWSEPMRPTWFERASSWLGMNAKATA